jgi:hypothetical protein
MHLRSKVSVIPCTRGKRTNTFPSTEGLVAKPRTSRCTLQAIGISCSSLNQTEIQQSILGLIIKTTRQAVSGRMIRVIVSDKLSFFPIKTKGTNHSFITGIGFSGT